MRENFLSQHNRYFQGASPEPGRRLFEMSGCDR